MAPLKMEEQMRQKLEARKINPSPEAWTKLSNRLDETAPNRSKGPFWWMGLAAAAVVVLLIINWTQKEDTSIDSQPVVDTEIPAVDQIDAVVKKDQPLEEIQAQEELVTESEAPQKNKEVALTETAESTQEKIEKSSAKIEETQFAFQNIEDPSNENSEVENSTTEQSAEVVGINLDENKSDAADALNEEVDQLLKKALDKAGRKETHAIKPDKSKAYSLLQEVEDDLDGSFRAKVFDALVNGYESVKTAVAERNN
ncbi:MAG: hypothetical protein KJN59_13415 [Bacteroidia bacterium]|nr:hypothetical protein [Bacteroidia bacterium]